MRQDSVIQCFTGANPLRATDILRQPRCPEAFEKSLVGQPQQTTSKRFNQAQFGLIEDRCLAAGTAPGILRRKVSCSSFARYLIFVTSRNRENAVKIVELELFGSLLSPTTNVPRLLRTTQKSNCCVKCKQVRPFCKLAAHGKFTPSQA